MHCHHDMPFGARLREGADGVVFRLWAPAARQAEVAIETGGRAPELHPARADAQGWWECVVPHAAEGTPYRWRIDGQLLVPDPASRHNPDGPHGPSVVVDPRQFEWDAGWTGRPWHDTVLYALLEDEFWKASSLEASS